MTNTIKYNYLITKEQKDWFGNGEYDIDLMLKMGVITEKFLYDVIRVLIDSPWYNPNFAKKYHNENI